MPSYKLGKLLLLVSILLLNACSGGNDSVVVGASITEPNNTVAETIRLNNCGGKADAEQIVERTQTISIEGEAKIGVGYEVLETSVTAKYLRSNAVRKSQKLVAPPGTNMEFVLLWTEDVRFGMITVEGKTGQATYRIYTPIAVELVSSQDLGCEAVQPVVPIATTPVPPSPTPTIVVIEVKPTATWTPVLPTPAPTRKPENKEHIILPLEGTPIPSWPSDLGVWSNAESVEVQGGCARLWRDLTWKGGPRDYLTVCNNRENLGEGWSFQVKEVEVDCTSNSSVAVTLWVDPNFTGGYWQHTFCVQ